MRRLNIVIPIAGPDKDPANTGYVRSLQEIQRKTILQYAFESLQSICASNFVVVIKQKDVNHYHLDNVVKLLRPEAKIIIAEGETMGAACTCMLAVDQLDMDAPLLITGVDQILTVSTFQIVEDFINREFDGGVVIFDDIHPRWSFVKLDERGFVIEAAEKRPISRNATAGFYYFKKASCFFEAAQKMISKNASVNGSFFVCPVFNEMILQQMSIGTYRIEKDQYYSFSHDSGIEAYKMHLKKQSEGGGSL
jgi:dTDP-glucose pyrophosphorylase